MFLYKDKLLPDKKELRTSLKTIYGVGWIKANNIVNKVGIKYPYAISNLNNYQINLLLFLLKGLVISDTKIQRQYESNIRKLILNNSYRGQRHFMCLPVRGQRTRTNAKTQKRKRIKNNDLNEEG